MPLPTTDIIDWIIGLGWDAAQETGAPILMGPYVQEEPDKIVTVTPIPGPGFVMDAAADAGAFQARVRGGQDDQPGAESLAYALDSLILGAQFPVTIGGRTLIHVHRLGSTPSPLAADPDDGTRYSYVTTYICIAGV